MHCPFNEGKIKSDSIGIEDDVWLGLRVIVLPGVTICKGGIIGAGAVLTKDTEAYGVYVGVPARLIQKRKKGFNNG